ncbi:NEW3 domain-containing protein [Limisphaera sp. VF-2]
MTKLCWMVGLLGWLGSGADPLLAATSTNDLPERYFTAAFQYPGVRLSPEDSLNVDVRLKNRGRSDETVLLEVTEQPADWNVEIRRYGTAVTGVFLPSGEDQTLTFTARPKDRNLKRLPEGTYRFAIRAHTPDNALVRESSLVVTVSSGEHGPERITLETSYPTLRGSSGDKFQFSLDVRNETGQDAVFNFRATAPQGWQTSFRPAYESKQITSLQINAGSSRSIEFEVTPPYRAQAGEYDFKVEVEAGRARAEKDLKVVLTGTYDLKVGTPSGLLSLVTERGKKTTATLLVQNTGSAPQREISFQSFKPENWKVEFSPEKLENVQPGEVKQVEVSITPAEQALVGDYSVSLAIDGERVNRDLEFRVTIRAGATWGWVGLAIIVLVVAGLGVTFHYLGRR